jgi:lysophospholipase L1-like esterase
MSNSSNKDFTLLCLGDSYTIGESVPLHEGFPYQTIQKLRKAGWSFAPAEVVAKTGWTTFELMVHLDKTILNQHYDFVTLLIGVNNQYRGLSIADFEKDFIALLQKAIAFASGKSKKVMVLSIPDWGLTQFAKSKNVNAEKISKEIDAFNEVCQRRAASTGCHYINITDETRQAKEHTNLLASDGLHYSAVEHEVWANFVAHKIMQ